jgi:hypothetical protein
MATITKPRTGELSISKTATKEDARLLVEIFNGPLGARAGDGMQILWAYDKAPTYEEFNAHHPIGTDGRRNVDAVLTMHETVGTFVKQGLLDRDLVYDLLWVKGVWERCHNIALHYRKRSGEPEIYANFERLAKAQT